jgi:hypothetical protein
VEKISNPSLPQYSVAHSVTNVVQWMKAKGVSGYDLVSTLDLMIRKTLKGWLPLGFLPGMSEWALPTAL